MRIPLTLCKPDKLELLIYYDTISHLFYNLDGTSVSDSSIPMVIWQMAEDIVIRIMQEAGGANVDEIVVEVPEHIMAAIREKNDKAT